MTHVIHYLLSPPCQVCALKQKMQSVRKVEPSLPELEWDSAVLALSRNRMDIEETFYAIQTEWLQPLYEYVYSEYTGVAKTDMEEIKKIIKDEQQYSLEVCGVGVARGVVYERRGTCSLSVASPCENRGSGDMQICCAGM